MQNDRRKVVVTAQGSQYDIVIGDGLLAKVGEYLIAWKQKQEAIDQIAWKKKRAAVIADEAVAKLYGATVERSLRESGIECVLLTIPSGEESKCQAQLFRLYNELIAANITRSDVILALGGGVTGDLVGYAAATYLRGVPCVQLPTTLLAQVDSSVGGKVAIDLPQGKNLVGTFSQPALVLADTETLATLPPREFSAGMAEVIKYGCILDAQLFRRLKEETDIRRILSDVIARCCELKATVVSRDPLDKGDRMLLNFGHTLGHAIETTAGYGRVLHGEGVAIGMVAAARWGERWGQTPAGTAETIQTVLASYGLPTDLPAQDAEAILVAMGADKKSMGDEINIVLLRKIGAAFYSPLPKEQLADAVRADMG